MASTRSVDEQRVLEAVRAMPYGGMTAGSQLRRIAQQRTTGAITMHLIAEYLEELRETLTEVQNANRITENELGELRADIKAVGRMFRRIQENGV